MLSHERVWAAIDALAERHSLSASGLAKRAGLDSTAFNKSKRRSNDGRPRWPSTEKPVEDHRGDALPRWKSSCSSWRATSASFRPAAGAEVERSLARLCASRRRRLLRRCRLSGRAGLGPCRTSRPPRRQRLCAAGAGRFHAAPLPRRRHVDRRARRHHPQGRPRRREDPLRRGHGQGAAAPQRRRDRAPVDQSGHPVRRLDLARSNGSPASSGRASRAVERSP